MGRTKGGRNHAQRAERAVPLTRADREPPSRLSRSEKRSKNRPARPGYVGRRVAGPSFTGGPRPTGGTLDFRIRISDDEVDRTISPGDGSLTQAQFDRWAAIRAGMLPEDDDTPWPPSDDDIEEVEAEIDLAWRRWGRLQDEARAEEAQERFDDLDRAHARRYREAEALEEDAARDGRAARHTARRAQDIRDRADDDRQEGYNEVRRWARAERDAIAEAVNEGRDEDRQTYAREVTAMREVAADRISELQSGLYDEMSNALSNQWMANGNRCEVLEVEGW